MNILSESQGRLDENQDSCAGQHQGKAKECRPCRLDSAYLSATSSLCGCRGRDEVRAGGQPSKSRAVGEPGDGGRLLLYWVLTGDPVAPGPAAERDRVPARFKTSGSSPGVLSSRH